MSRVNYGENIWRLHDHIPLPDGSRRLFFRNACEDFDYSVHSSVFQPSPTLTCRCTPDGIEPECPVHKPGMDISERDNQ